MFVDSSEMFPRVRGGIAESRMGCRVRCGVRVRRGIKELECGVADLGEILQSQGGLWSSEWDCRVTGRVTELGLGLWS